MIRNEILDARLSGSQSWTLAVIVLVRSPPGCSLVTQMVKNPPAMQETGVRALGWEDPPGEGHGMATHSSILAWRIRGTEEPGGLQSIELQGSDATEWLSTRSCPFHPYAVPNSCWNLTFSVLVAVPGRSSRGTQWRASPLPVPMLTLLQPDPGALHLWCLPDLLGLALENASGGCAKAEEWVGVWVS